MGIDVGIDVESKQNFGPQNMSLWPKDDLKLAILRNCAKKKKH